MSVTWTTTEPANVVEWSANVTGTSRLFLSSGKYGCYINVVGAICRLDDNQICAKVGLQFDKYYTWANGNSCALAPKAAGEQGDSITVYYSQTGTVATYYAILPADYAEETIQVGNYLVNAADGVYVTLTVPASVAKQPKLWKKVGGVWTEVTLEMASKDMSAGLVDGSLTAYSNETVTSVRRQAFMYYTGIKTIDLPSATTIGQQAFAGSGVSSVNLPVAHSFGTSAFMSCGSLESIALPMISEIPTSCFATCSALKTVDVGYSEDTTTNMGIDTRAFYGCYSLTALIIRYPSVAPLANTNAFTNCYRILGTTNSTYNPDGAQDGYIYVPDDMVDTYKSVEVWSNFASQIKSISEYAG